MGFLRLLWFGVSASTRSKRILIFIVFFIVLSGVTAFSINEIDRERRDLLLEQRAIVIEQNSFDSNNEDDTDNIVLAFGDSSKVVVVKYINLPSINMRIFSVDTSIPWANTITQPDEIRQGHYLQSTNAIKSSPETWEAILSDNFIEIDSTAGNAVASLYSVGSIVNFTGSNAESLHFKTVGIFEKPYVNYAPETENEIWMLISDNVFDGLVDLLGMDDATEVYIYQIVVVSNGYSETLAAAILGDAKAITEENSQIASNLVSSSNWRLKDPPDTNKIKSQATTTDIILVLGCIGAPVVATLYAFIISRFRTREIAIMKAVGYSNGNVQAMLLTEIGTVSIIGYLISIFGLQIIFTLNSRFSLNTTYVPTIWNPINLNNPWPSWTAILTFIIVVLSNALGFLIISRRSISVRPVELFKGI
ncbi:MAG: FtsX-like permease family protein [Candidatus Hodarchaeales archaeon]|jgi:hypothetical protein